MAYWTHYWKNSTVRAHQANNEESDELLHTADDTFEQRGVAIGDTVYVVTVLEGSVHLIGRLVVDQVLNQQEADKYFGEPVWTAVDHLIGMQPLSQCQYDVSVPYSRLDEVIFVTSSGNDVIKFDQRDGADPHAVDRQTLRGVRKITADTAALFDSLLS